jgi:hypothetical protein
VLGHPGHRFDPERIDGPEGGDEEARPEGPRHGLDRGEEKGRDEGVEQDAGQVVPGRGETVEFHVEEVREPGQRVPVGGIEGGHGPANRRGSEPL